MRKSIIAILFISLMLVFSGCNANIGRSASTSSLNTIESTAAYVSPTPTVNTIPSATVFVSLSPSPSASQPVSVADKFPMSVNDFLTKYLFESLGKGDWVPKEILNYSEDFSTKTVGWQKGYIKSIDADTVVIEKINWVQDSKDGSGFDIVDTHTTAKYGITSDTQFWLIIEAGGFYQISFDDLLSYNKQFGQTLWNVSVTNNKVEMLVEQYLP